jgi:integrase
VHGRGGRRQDAVHHAAMAYQQVGRFVHLLHQRQAPLASRLAFEFLILTASRSGETRGALWSEIDMADRLWTIPAARMKARSAHSVPLSKRALEILEQVRAAHCDSQLCFPNARGKPFSDMVFTKTLRDMKLGFSATAHGFRTSFKTWAAETGIRDEVSEAALAHADANQVRAAYRRTTYLDERRGVMEDWAKIIGVWET